MSNDSTVSESNIEITEGVIITFIEKIINKISGISLYKKKKAIRIINVEKGRKIELSLEVDYGIIIPEVVEKLQKEIIATIKNMTGVDIIKINVTIDGLNIANLLER